MDIPADANTGTIKVFGHANDYYTVEGTYR